MATDSVAFYGVAVFLAYGKPNLGLLVVTRTIKHHKVPVRNALGVLVDVVVLTVLFKSVNRLQLDWLLNYAERE